MLHMVVHWHKLGDVEIEYILHNYIVLAIFVSKIIKVAKNLTNCDKNNFHCF